MDVGFAGDEVDILNDVRFEGKLWVIFIFVVFLPLFDPSFNLFLHLCAG